jgi:MFS transporter, MHS family, proline/betaine transporter
MHHPDWSRMLLGQFGFAILIGLFAGVLSTTMAEAFPARVRVTAVAIAYNLSLGVLGVTTPMVAMYLLTWTHDALAPAHYVIGAAAVSVEVLLRWRETVQAPLP